MSTAAWPSAELRPVGVVLVGGSSRRMGRDKATLAVDGQPLGLRAIRALDGLGLDVVLLGGSVDHVRLLRRPSWPDAHPGDGPMAALASFLSGGRDALALPCDLPNVRAETLAPLLAGDPPHLARLATRADRPAFPIGWWRSQAADALGAAMAAGERSFSRGLASSMGEVELVELSNAIDDADVPEELDPSGTLAP